MPNMSFAITTEQIRNRTKTVTRRLGWEKLRPGALVWAVEKCQGLKKGERVTRIAQLRVVNVRRERLGAMLPPYSIHNGNNYGEQEVAKEGFPNSTPAEFVAMFCKTHKPCEPWWLITRIEFEYTEAKPCPEKP
jgi:hypothetical protein